MDIVVPKIALTMTEATIGQWLRSPGDEVKKGEALFTMQTDKSVVEVEAPADGVLSEIHRYAGETVEVGGLVGVLRVEGESAVQDSQASERHVAVAPEASRLAEALGIEVARVRGTGPGGRVTEADVILAGEAEASPGVVPSGSDHGAVRLTSTRARSAGVRALMAAPGAPIFYVGRRVQVPSLGGGGSRVKAGPTDLMVVAAARALRRHPRANGYATNEGALTYSEVRIGVLVRVDDSLVAITIRDPDLSSLDEVSRKRASAGTALGSGRMGTEASISPTFVISNLGKWGVDAFSAVLYPGTSATLAVGTLQDDGASGRSTYVVLTCDHRVLDGVEAASFLQDFATELSTLGEGDRHE